MWQPLPARSNPSPNTLAVDLNTLQASLASLGLISSAAPGTNVTLTLTSDRRWAFRPSAGINLNLPTTGILLGDCFEIANLSNTYTITIKSSGGNTVKALLYGRIVLRANQSTPTAAGHWDIISSESYVSVVSVVPDFVHVSGSPTAVSNNQPLIFPSKITDTNNNYNTSNGYFTPSYTGRYIWSGYWGGSNAAQMEVHDWTGGSDQGSITRGSNPGASGTYVFNCITLLTAGRSYVIDVFTNGGMTCGGGELTIAWVN